MLTLDDVARHWALTPGTVRAMVRNGAVEAVRLAGRYRMTWSAVWAAERGRAPRANDGDRYRTPLLRKADVAARMRVSVRTVERWIADGMPTRSIGDNVRLNASDVDRWLRGRYGVGMPDMD